MVLVPGEAEGLVLRLDEPISFWGGVDSATGVIIDAHHPQRGSCISGCILVLPGTRGSTAGPGALLELLNSDHGPAGVVLTRPDIVCVIAVKALAALGASGIPVLSLEPAKAEALRTGTRWRVADGNAWLARTL